MPDDKITIERDYLEKLQQELETLLGSAAGGALSAARYRR